MTRAEKTTKAAPPRKRPAWRRVRVEGSVSGACGARDVGARGSVRGVVSFEGVPVVGVVVGREGGSGLEIGRRMIGLGRSDVDIRVDEVLPIVLLDIGCSRA